MARNGSGTFSRNYDFTADRDAGSPSNIISADKVDTEFDDIATALTASIAKDGQTTPTANLPMGGFKLTGVATAAPAARSEYVSVAAQQDSMAVFADGGGTADAITAAISPAPTALVNGQRFRVRATAANATTTASSGRSFSAVRSLSARSASRAGKQTCDACWRAYYSTPDAGASWQTSLIRICRQSACSI